MEALNRRVLEGRLDSLPPEDKSDITVFVSSTFTDMSVERNHIMNLVTSELDKYCLQKRLSFRFIDMRWGVRDEASVDHTTEEIVLDAVRTAKDESRGPFFLCLLGDKYGSRLLPHYVNASEYKLLRRIAMRRGYDISIMDEWFERDDNAEPPVYRLRSINEILSHYDDHDNEALQSKDKEKWNQVQDKLLTMFRAAADEAYTDGLISKEARHVYFKSVTESEVEEGVVYQDPVRDKVIVYFRKFLDINIDDAKAGRFIDLKDGKIDSEAEELRERLKLARVQPRLGPSQLKKFHLNWTPIGIDEANEQHKEYLDNLIKDIIDKLKRQVDQCVKDETYLNLTPLYKEVLHHLHLCKKETQQFAARQDILDSLKERMFLVYNKSGNLVEMTEEIQNDATLRLPDSELEGKLSVKDTEKLEAGYHEIQETLDKFGCKFIHSGYFQNKDTDPNVNQKERFVQLPDFQYYSRPVVLIGVSGSGKTAMMAKVAEESQNWFPNSVSVIRFLGTSLLSFTIQEVLVSICAQIISLYKVLIPAYIDMEKDYQFLSQFFNSLLWKIDTSSRPLIIVLDSIDQLSDMNEAHTLDWLPVNLPVNVHMIVSMIPNVHCCLQNMLGKMPCNEQYLDMSTMSQDAADEMISISLRNKCRRVTKIQRRFILGNFEHCPYPLYMRLILDQAASWRSSTVTSDLSVGDNINGAIIRFFSELERIHGELTIRKTIAYMSASRDGISVTELEDLLSLSDEVLQDTYLYHLPPNDRHIRIPPSVMSQMMSDITPYIIIRKVGPFKILTWFHRQFKEVCSARYLPKDQIQSVHRELADYFQGIWFNKVKPLTLYKVKKGEFLNADRGVREQNIRCMHMYNVRKLSELPFHLIKSHQFEKLRDLCVANFEFLQGFVHVLTVGIAIRTIKLALQTMDAMGEIDSPQVYEDMDSIYQILMKGSEKIRKDQNNLAVEIIAQLGPTYSGSPCLKSLVRDALTWLREADTAALVPLNRTAPGPESVLKFSITTEVFSKDPDDQNRCYDHVFCVDERRGVLRCIYTVGEQRYLYMLCLETDGMVKARRKIQTEIQSVQMAGGDRFIILQNSESTELYEVESWTAAPLQYNPVDFLAVSQSGRILAYSSVLNSKVVVCQIGNTVTSMTALFILDLENILMIQISPDDQFLVVINDNMDLSTYNIHTAERLYRKDTQIDRTEFPNHSKIKERLSRTVRVTADNKLIRMDPKTSAICLMDLVSGECVYTLSRSEHGSANIVSMHSSGKFLATVDKTRSNTLDVWRVWDLQKATLLSSLDNAAELDDKGDESSPPGCESLCEVVQNMLLFGPAERLFLAILESGNLSVVKVFYLGSDTSPLAVATPYCNLIGHHRTILQMCIAMRETRLLTVSQDDTIKVWDLQKMVLNFTDKFGRDPKPQEVRSYFDRQVMAESTTTKLDISRDEKKAFITTTSGQLIVHDLENNMLHHSHKIEGDRTDFLMMSSSGQLVVMATSKGKITILSAEKYDVKHILNHRKPRIDCMAENNNILVAGTGEMEAKGSVWNIESGELLREFEFLYSLHVVGLTSTGDKIVTSFFDFPVVLTMDSDYNTMDMTQVDTVMASASCIAIDNADSHALIGSSDGQIRVINMAGKYEFRLGQNSPVSTAVFSPDREKVVSAGYKSLFVWDLNLARLLYKVKKHDNFITKILFDRSGKVMVTASKDKKIIMSDISYGMSIATYYGHNSMDQLKITSYGGKVLFIPDIVNYIGVLEPNAALRKMMDGDRAMVRKSLMKAKAMALSFSSQKIAPHTSQACSIL